MKKCGSYWGFAIKLNKISPCCAAISINNKLNASWHLHTNTEIAGRWGYSESKHMTLLIASSRPIRKMRESSVSWRLVLLKFCALLGFSWRIKAMWRFLSEEHHSEYGDRWNKANWNKGGTRKKEGIINKIAWLLLIVMLGFWQCG